MGRSIRTMLRRSCWRCSIPKHIRTHIPTATFSMATLTTTVILTADRSRDSSACCRKVFFSCVGSRYTELPCLQNDGDGAHRRVAFFIPVDPSVSQRFQECDQRLCFSRCGSHSAQPDSASNKRITGSTSVQLYVG